MKRKLPPIAGAVGSIGLAMGIVLSGGTTVHAQPFSLADKVSVTKSVSAPNISQEIAQIHEMQFSHETTARFRITSFGPRMQAWYLLPLKVRKHEYPCLRNIVMRESSWNVHAYNSYSGAYGIPQALPGWKMAGHMWYVKRDGSKGHEFYGKNWQGSGYVQLFWMIKRYIPARYGTACSAWNHEVNYGWY